MLHQLLWPLLEALQVVIGLKVTRGFLEDGKDWRLFRIHHLIDPNRDHANRSEHAHGFDPSLALGSGQT